MDIHDTLGEAIALLDQAKPRAFGAGSVVDRDRLLQLLQHARTVLPEEILAAASIVAQRNSLIASAESQVDLIRSEAQSSGDQIRAAALADAEHVRAAAQQEAENLIERAEREREAMIDEHLVQEQARAQAEDMVARAAHQAAAMRTEVDAYVDAKLASIASTLARTLDTIEAGRRKVRAQADSELEDTVAVP